MVLTLSHLDYCHSHLAGLSSKELLRLQKIQNNAVRFVFWNRKKKSHVTPLLCELQWLPVEFGVEYKLATIAFGRFDGSLPPSFVSVQHL